MCKDLIHTKTKWSYGKIMPIGVSPHKLQIDQGILITLHFVWFRLDL